LSVWTGVGDAPPPAAPGTIDSPEPAAFEVPCNKLVASAGHLYFYVEAEAPEWDVRVLTCTAPDAPFTPPVCEPTTYYVIEDGMIGVLCGEWTLGTEVPDFVRIEEASL
jgi:hypothetical protein